MTEPLVDADALKRYSFNVWSYKQGEIVSLMIHIGDRLGLYRALNGAGPVTAAELASAHRIERALAVRMAARPGGGAVARLSRS